jgi:hypothetical protein
VGQPIPLHIDYRFTTASSTRPDEIQLEMPLTDLEPRNITNTHRFESVDTPAGLFNLQVTYRQYCDLTVNDPEQLLSSRLIDMEENYFSPSLVQESRMRTLLQRDRKRDGELSMPSSPINTVSYSLYQLIDSLIVILYSQHYIHSHGDRDHRFDLCLHPIQIHHPVPFSL